MKRDTKTLRRPCNYGEGSPKADYGGSLGVHPCIHQKSPISRGGVRGQPRPPEEVQDGGSQDGASAEGD